MNAGVEKANPSMPAGWMDSHRAWLTKLGISDKPWLILGSAPDPTLPDEIRRSHARIDINNAGLTAQRLGLGAADLTVRKKSKPWSEHPTLQTRGLLWFHTAPYLFLYAQLLFLPRVGVKTIMRTSRAERDAMVDIVAGVSPKDAGGDNGKVTNGIAAACYGLLLGVPEIVLAGFSLSKDGHSYNDTGRRRRQVSEDAFVLERLKERPNLHTTEADLAADAGIRLWQP